MQFLQQAFSNVSSSFYDIEDELISKGCKYWIIVEVNILSDTVYWYSFFFFWYDDLVWITQVSQLSFLTNFCSKMAGTITDLYVAPSPSAVPEVLQSPSIHDLQVYGVILTVVLCLIVFGGVKIINRVSPAFLIPVILSLFFIFIGIFAARRSSDPRKWCLPFSFLMCCWPSYLTYWNEDLGS